MPDKKSCENLEKRIHELEQALSAQKRINAELRESQARFRLLYEIVPLGYQSLDGQGNFLEVNQSWLDLLGYSREEVIGKSFPEFLHPDWKFISKKTFPGLKRPVKLPG